MVSKDYYLIYVEIMPRLLAYLLGREFAFWSPMHIFQCPPHYHHHHHRITSWLSFENSLFLCLPLLLPLPRNLKLRSLIPTSRHIIFDFCISCVSKTGNSKRALEPHDLKASWGHVRCYTAASQRGPPTGLYECRKKQKNWWWFALRDANEAKALRPSLLLRQRAFFATVKKLRWCSLFWNEGNFEKMQLFSSSFVTAFRVRCNF